MVETSFAMTQDPLLLVALMRRITIAEAMMASLEEEFVETPVQRIKSDLSHRNVRTSVFVQVADGYYEKTLAMRAEILKCSVPQLCKSIIFENTAWVKEDNDLLGDTSNSRFYLVVVQYQGPYRVLRESSYDTDNRYTYKQIDRQTHIHTGLQMID